ncbi:mCG140080, isoform CRA_b, partial [Mus musculus]
NQLPYVLGPSPAIPSVHHAESQGSQVERLQEMDPRRSHLWISPCSRWSLFSWLVHLAPPQLVPFDTVWTDFQQAPGLWHPFSTNTATKKATAIPSPGDAGLWQQTA